MASPTRHLTRCLTAGVVALLPLGGTVLAITWLERSLASAWRESAPFYFPGLGILLAVLAIYLVGMCVTTFLGRWLWRSLDRVIASLPLLGSFYESLKEVLGYDSARERFFGGVVAIPTDGGIEIGLLTGACDGPSGERRAIVFVPGSPNPTNGRLVLVEQHAVTKMDTRVADALRALVSMGKTSFTAGRASP